MEFIGILEEMQGLDKQGGDELAETNMFISQNLKKNFQKL